MQNFHSITNKGHHVHKPKTRRCWRVFDVCLYLNEPLCDLCDSRRNSFPQQENKTRRLGFVPPLPPSRLSGVQQSFTGRGQPLGGSFARSCVCTCVYLWSTVADCPLWFGRSSQHLPLKSEHHVDHLQAAGDLLQDAVLLPQLVQLPVALGAKVQRVASSRD